METTSKTQPQTQLKNEEVKEVKKVATKKAASKKDTEKLFVTRGKEGKEKQISAVRGNVNGELIPMTETHLVHFYMNDYSIPKHKDPVLRKEFARKKKVMDAQEFLMCFQSNYINDFRNMDSPEMIYRVLVNMSPEVIEKFYQAEIPQQMQGLERRDYIANKLMPVKARLSLNGGNMYVFKNDFIHVPNLESTDLPNNI